METVRLSIQNDKPYLEIKLISILISVSSSLSSETWTFLVQAESDTYEQTNM